MSKKLLAIGLLSLMSMTAFAESEKDLAIEESISLMKCIRKNVRKKSFGKNKALLTNILGSAIDQEGRLSENVDILSHAKESCLKKETTNILILESKQIEKAKKILDKMANPYLACQFAAVDANVALGLGLGVGATVYKCNSSDASIKLFAGPRLSVGLGIGVFVVANYSDERGMQESAPRYFEPLLVDNNLVQVNYSGDAMLGLLLAHSGDYVSEGYGVGAGILFRDKLDFAVRVGSLPSDWKGYVKTLRQGM